MFGPFDFETKKCLLRKAEAPAKMGDHVRLALIENAQRKVCIGRKPCQDVSTILDCQCDERGLKRTLLDPTDQHAGFVGVVSNRQNEEPAGNFSKG